MKEKKNILVIFLWLLFSALVYKAQAQCGVNGNVSDATNHSGITGTFNTGEGTLGACGALGSNLNTGIYNTCIGYTVGNGFNNGNSTANTAVGALSLSASNNANTNSAFGAYTLSTAGTFSNCTAVGAYALKANQADNNTAVGYKSLAANTTGTPNTAFGAYSLAVNTSGSNNVGIGTYSLNSNNGSWNTAIGAGALQTNATGSQCTAAGVNALNGGTTSTCTAVGYQAMKGNNTGTGDAFGFEAMLNNGGGTSNVAIGAYSMHAFNTGSNNTGVGNASLSGNMAGNNNTAFGYQASVSTNTASDNTSFGYQAGDDCQFGQKNVSIGYTALYHSHTDLNTAVGSGAIFSNTKGYYNTALGKNALHESSLASYGTAIGYNALYWYSSSSSGNGISTAVGSQALQNATTPANFDGENVALGYQSMLHINTGNYNSAFGLSSLGTETSGDSNTALGYGALFWQATSNANTAVGFSAGGLWSYSGCTFLGYSADANASGYRNSMAIGYNAIVTASNSIKLGDASVLRIRGQVAYNYSDGRFKENITEEVKGLDFIEKLRPIVYNLECRKLDEFWMKNMPKDQVTTRLDQNDYSVPTSLRRSGFIAQEVEKAAAQTGYNFSAVHKPENKDDNYSLDYDEFVVPLVKAMQDEQYIIESDSTMYADVQNKLEVLVAQMQDIKDCCKNTDANNNSQSKVAELYNAVPNPTTNATVISFYIPESAAAARVELKNWSGTVVRTFGTHSFGNSSLTMQTDQLSPGTYYYSLIVDERIINTRKLTVLK